MSIASTKMAASTHNQRLLVAKLLREAPNNTLHTYELRESGVGEPPSRISELNKRGYKISVIRKNATDAHGYEHKGVAYYTLINEPSKGVSNE